MVSEGAGKGNGGRRALTPSTTRAAVAPSVGSVIVGTPKATIACSRSTRYASLRAEMVPTFSRRRRSLQIHPRSVVGKKGRKKGREAYVPTEIVEPEAGGGEHALALLEVYGTFEGEFEPPGEWFERVEEKGAIVEVDAWGELCAGATPISTPCPPQTTNQKLLLTGWSK